MKLIYCPHLQEMYKDNEMIWLKYIGLSVSLGNDTSLILCEECARKVKVRVLSDAAKETERMVYAK